MTMVPVLIRGTDGCRAFFLHPLGGAVKPPEQLAAEAGWRLNCPQGSTGRPSPEPYGRRW